MKKHALLCALLILAFSCKDDKKADNTAETTAERYVEETHSYASLILQ